MTSPDPTSILAQINSARDQTYQNLALLQAQANIATDAAEAAARERAAVAAMSQQAVTVDTSVGTRVFAGDVMIHGDTGVREVFSLMTSEFTLWTNGPDIPTEPSSNTFLRMQRVGEQVNIWGRVAAGSALDGLPRSAERALVGMPIGYRPDRNFILVGQWAAFSDNTRGIMRNRGTDLSIRDGMNMWRGGELIYLNASWRTMDSWPTSLPGIPG